MAGKKFKSISDMMKYYNSPKSQADLIDDTKIKTSLAEASKLLERILREKVQEYYDSYEPIKYKRTYDFLNSIKISPIVREGNTYTFSVYFDQDIATHPSYFNGEDGYVPILLNEGFSWKEENQPVPPIHHLSYYEGFHFVEDAIKDFNKQNKWGLTLRKEAVYHGISI